MASTAALADDVKVVRRADEELAVGDGRGAEAIFVEVVFGQHLKLRPGLDDARHSVLARHVELAV
ncbi:MAG: hypothetical protein LC802_06365, partial [Acidobacteria bacterium]|nr:hypothetical protein [Acidobacteriota bacterium]